MSPMNWEFLSKAFLKACPYPADPFNAREGVTKMTLTSSTFLAI